MPPEDLEEQPDDQEEGPSADALRAAVLGAEIVSPDHRQAEEENVAASYDNVGRDLVAQHHDGVNEVNEHQRDRSQRRPADVLGGVDGGFDGEEEDHAGMEQ
eukprot:470913-Hanusia_phi.AAC.3